MEKEKRVPVKISSIAALHRLLQLPKPVHPLISLVDNTQMNISKDDLPDSFLFDFYKISYKKTTNGKMGYGQGYYDFEEGGMLFTAPGQLISITDDEEYYGLSLLVHPDFLRNYPLGKSIRQMGFFSYDTNEALHLSDKEKTVIMGVLQNIKDELQEAIDDFSQDVVVAYMEVLLGYSQRFYKRQFITRKAVNHDLLTRMEQLLNDYFDQELSLQKGVPTVEYLAAQLYVSPRYLSDMLRSLTGQNAQHHIHDKLIEKAREKLSSTSLSVGEIAFQLGFEYPQSFNKLFKNKTSQTPLEFRQLFN